MSASINSEQISPGNILNDDSSIVGKLLEVRLKCQVVVHRLHVGGQDLTAQDIGRAGGLAASSATHSAVGAVSLGGLKERRTGRRTSDARS